MKITLYIDWYHEEIYKTVEEVRAAFDSMISNCDYTYEMSDWMPADFEEWFNESEYTPYDVWKFTDSERAMVKAEYKEYCDELFDQWFDEKIEQKVIEV
jgi:hypothetical protein